MSRAKQILRDQRGTTIIEFAFVAPVLLLLIIGAMELGHQIYAQSILQGAVQQAARDATLESGPLQKSAIDNKVEDLVMTVLPNAHFDFKRTNYAEFSQVGQPEDFVDLNKNGKHDAKECFTDMNGNNAWDEDLGKNGVGNADDVVSYTVDVEYRRLFPLWALMGWSNKVRMSANTVLRNQPYTEQTTRTVKQVCP